MKLQYGVPRKNAHIGQVVLEIMVGIKVFLLVL